MSPVLPNFRYFISPNSFRCEVASAAAVSRAMYSPPVEFVFRSGAPMLQVKRALHLARSAPTPVGDVRVPTTDRCRSRAEMSLYPDKREGPREACSLLVRGATRLNLVRRATTFFGTQAIWYRNRLVRIPVLR
jgi:hypothetical protein